MGYMMGGFETFLTRGEAREFGRLFMYEGHRKPLPPDTILFCRNESYYAIWTWSKAYPLKTLVRYLKGNDAIKAFWNEHKDHPLIACDEVDVEEPEFNSAEYEGVFRRRIQPVDDNKLYRVILAAYEEEGISYSNKERIRKRTSYHDENISVGTARELGPFCYDTYPDFGDSFYITSSDVCIAVRAEGGEQWLCCSQDRFSFDTPERLIASILGTQELEIEGLDLPARYIKGEEYYKKLDRYEFEFKLIDEEASASDFPVVMYSCRFKNRKKEVTITSLADLLALVRRWIKHPGWGSLDMTAYTVIGDW